MANHQDLRLRLRVGLFVGGVLILFMAFVLVIGSHGRTGFERLLLGSVAEKVLRQASCPVMVVPRGAPDQLKTVGVARVQVEDQRVAGGSAHGVMRGLVQMRGRMVVTQGQSEPSAAAAVKRSSGQTSIPSSVLS